MAASVRKLGAGLADKAADMPGETVHQETPHRAMITACAIGATVLQLLDQTIANVALPYPPVSEQLPRG